MRVGYNKTIGVILLVLAAVCGILLVVSGAFARMDMSFFGPGLATISCTMCGIGYLTRPYFQLDDGRITLFALIGPLRREYPFASPKDLRLVEGKLYLGDKKLPISRAQCDRADWDRFLARIAAA